MTPIAHTASGLLGWQLGGNRKTLRTLVLFVLVSNLPDLDLVFAGILGSRPLFTHQAYTHNLLFVLAAGLGLSLFLGGGARGRPAFFLTALSHFPLDIIVLDTVPPIGFRLLYPFSAQVFYLGFFPYAEKSRVFSAGNLVTFGLETLFFLLPVVLLFRKTWFRLLRSPEFWDG